MDAKITVIIPCYNNEDHLHYSIDSLLRQTYQDFKVILVDDGSTDSTGRLCDNYASQDDRFSVIHKENGGVSSARNIALDIVVTDYVLFMDSDDYYEDRSLEFMMKVMEKTDADAVCTRLKWSFDYDDHVEQNFSESDLESHFYLTNAEGLLTELYYGLGTTAGMPGKLIKKTFFDQLRFPLGKIYEDFYITYDLFSQMKSIAIGDIPTIRYMQRKGSLVHSGFSKKQLDFFEAINRVISQIEENGGSSSLLRAAKSRVISYGFYIIDMMIRSGEWDLVKEYRKVFKKQFFSYLLNNNIAKYKRKRYLYFCVSPKLYKALVINKNS